MTLPERVHLREVGPRDGFQNEPEVIPTAEKVRLIDLLARTGLRRIEVTSFVRPDVIPQLADAREVLKAIDVPAGVRRSVLVPNMRGLESALALRDRFEEVGVFLSASETHNRKNVNRSIEESLSGLERVLARAREHGLRCEGVISVAFGCPYEGVVDRGRVLAIARRLADAGAGEIGFGDTTGMANPAQVRSYFPAARDALGDEVELTAHFHTTGPAVRRCEPSGRPSTSCAARDASSSASSETPVSMPISCSIDSTSSVATLPVAPLGTGQPPSSPKLDSNELTPASSAASTFASPWPRVLWKWAVSSTSSPSASRAAGK